MSVLRLASRRHGCGGCVPRDDGRATGRWRHVAVLVGLAVALECAIPSARAKSIAAVLDDYAHGQFGSVAPLLKPGAVGQGSFGDALARDAPHWIAAGGRAAVQKRRLIAAIVALDAAHQLFADWSSGRRLLAWGCSVLRADSTPLPAERTWHLAFIALAEGEHDDVLLLGSGTALTAGVLPALTRSTEARAPDAAWFFPEIKDGHLAHAMARFPDEPRFQLAKVVAIQDLAWKIGNVGQSVAANSLMLPAEIAPNYLARLSEVGETKADAPQEAARVKELAATQPMLEALATPGPLLPSVRFYEGVLALRLAQRAVALERFADVERLTNDPRLLYPARILSGLVHERAEQWTQAAASYRAALQVAPRARTGETLLVEALERGGHAADASAEADSFLAAPSAPDPWEAFWRGDYWMFDGDLDQLRHAIQ